MTDRFKVGILKADGEEVWFYSDELPLAEDLNNIVGGLAVPLKGLTRWEGVDAMAWMHVHAEHKNPFASWLIWNEMKSIHLDINRDYVRGTIVVIKNYVILRDNLKDVYGAI